MVHLDVQEEAWASGFPVRKLHEMNLIGKFRSFLDGGPFRANWALKSETIQLTFVDYPHI